MVAWSVAGDGGDDDDDGDETFRLEEIYTMVIAVSGGVTAEQFGAMSHLKLKIFT